MNTQFNYTKPIKKQLEEKMHKECKRFLKFCTDNSLTPRYYNIRGIEGNILTFGSTQDKNFYFNIDLTNVKEYEKIIELQYYNPEKMWSQFKEFRTQFLKDNYPQIDTGENDKPITKGLFQITKELIEDKKKLTNIIENISSNYANKKEDKKETTHKQVYLNLDTIKTELKDYIIDRINDYDNIKKLVKDNELHHELFNTDFYIIGTYQAKEWLKEHNICTFEVCEYIKGYEIDNFGECYTDLSSAEKAVNMLVYIVGEELIYHLEDEILETIEQ